MQSVLSEIENGANLKHVDVIDKAAPMIENVTIKENPFKQVANEIAKPHELKHVTDVNDKSAPYIEADVHIKPNAHNDVMSELQRRMSQ